MGTKKVIIIEFYGIDNFNRPVFKEVDKKYFFGSVDVLFSNENDFLEKKDNFKKQVLNGNIRLYYFGTRFNCEPEGTHSEKWKFKIL